MYSNINNTSKKDISNKKIDILKTPKFIITKNKIPLKRINIRSNRNINKEKSIKVNKSNYYITSFKKEKSCEPLMKKRINPIIKKKLNFDNLNSTYNIEQKNRRLYTSPNKLLNKSNTKNKEFNKILFFEPLNKINPQKKKTFKINIQNINTIVIKNNKSTDKKNTRYEQNTKSTETSTINKINLNNYNNFNSSERALKHENKFTSTSKLMRAQEKWKRNYLATVIQKIYRGYSFRQLFIKYIRRRINSTIYIKKIPKHKNFANNKINNFNKNIIKRVQSNIIYNNKYKDNFLNTRNYSSKNFPKIKEIIIHRRKNSPIIDLNLNNCFLNGLNNYYNIYNSNNNFKENDKRITTTYRNNNGEIYWEKINLLIKSKKALNHWINISLKSKIIKSFINLKTNQMLKDINNNLKNDETYNTTNSSAEKRFINLSKNTKLFFVKNKK